MRSLPYDGATFGTATITEAGRQFLGGLLTQLSDRATDGAVYRRALRREARALQRRVTRSRMGARLQSQGAGRSATGRRALQALAGRRRRMSSIQRSPASIVAPLREIA